MLKKNLIVTAGLALFSGVTPLLAQQPEPGKGQPAVIELFTSQGCSSCPAADKLVGELSARTDVIALSFPVTYWDYLGWKDTFAKPEYSERQRRYAASRGDGEVYTPQAVINGIKGCVGSDRNQIEAAIKATQASLSKTVVVMAAKRDGERFLIEAGVAPEGSPHKSGHVFVAAVKRSTDVSIQRGENAGRTVTYTNVVRSFVDAGAWQGAATAFSIPVKGLTIDPGDTLVVFLQADKLGPIVAAARIKA